MIVDDNGFVISDEPEKGKTGFPKADDPFLSGSATKNEPMSPAERRKAAANGLYGYGAINDEPAEPEAEELPKVEESTEPEPSSEPVDGVSDEAVAEDAPEPKDEEAVDEPKAEDEYDLEADRDEGLREQVNSRGKGKEKKKKEKRKKDKARKTSPFVVIRIILSLVLIGAMCTTAVPRIQSALAVAKNATKESVVVDVDEQESQQDQQNVETVDTSYQYESYSYIDPAFLEQMSATDLVIWELREFPDGEMYNEVEYAEFQHWFDNRAETFPNFAENYQVALEYVNEHPELLAPAEEPNPDETAEETEILDDPALAEQADQATDSDVTTPAPTPAPVPTPTPVPTIPDELPDAEDAIIDEPMPEIDGDELPEPEEINESEP